MIADMREGMFMRDVNRSHGNGRVCGACGVRRMGYLLLALCVLILVFWLMMEG